MRTISFATSYQSKQPPPSDPFPLAPAGAQINGGLPNDATLCGTRLFAQAIELDPGAAKGVSFSQGLELLLGY